MFLIVNLKFHGFAIEIESMVFLFKTASFQKKSNDTSVISVQIIGLFISKKVADKTE